MKIFGENLRKARTERGLSQRALFSLCGIDNGMISRMENGQVNVTLNTLKILANALGVSPFKLLTEEIKAEDTNEVELNADPL